MAGDLLPLLADAALRDRILTDAKSLSSLAPDEVRECLLSVRHKDGSVRVLKTCVGVFKSGPMASRCSSWPCLRM